jgi:selenocysteine lyase/cysteine desulfurase
MVNFDNSAAAFPKPQSVKRAVMTALERYGGNPGRGGHRLSEESAKQIYAVRKKAADFFEAEPENVVFTPNCTVALNMAIKGIAGKGGHVIISCYEHNACARPVYAMWERGIIDYSVAEIYPDVDRTVEGVRKLIRPDTVCVCMTVASNVTGRILPYREIGEICRKKGICYIVDGAQGCGLLDLKMSDGFNFLCTSGQKSLYGPSGTGLLISDGRYTLDTIIEGGTGATSGELHQTEFLPERLESGSLNTAGIIGLGAGIDFVRSMGTGRIFAHEKRLCDLFEQRLGRVKGARIYDSEYSRLPIVAFNIGDTHSEIIAKKLSDRGFALRGGLHCAALTHKTLGTTEQGAVRFSPSVMNTEREVRALFNAQFTMHN